MKEGRAGRYVLALLLGAGTTLSFAPIVGANSRAQKSRTVSTSCS